MDKQALVGIVIGALGLGLSAAVGALYMLMPDPENLMLLIASGGSVLLLMLGLAIIAWPRNPPNGLTK